MIDNKKIIEQDQEQLKQEAVAKVKNLEAIAEKAQADQQSLFEKIFANIEAINPQLGGFEEIAALLALPDEQFNLIGPLFLDELQRSYNNVNDRMTLVQALNASGLNLDEYKNMFNDLTEQIDKQLDGQMTAIKRDFLKKIIAFNYNALAETEGINKKIIEIPIEISANAKMPTYAHPSDAGLDLYATEDIEIQPGETVVLNTGIKVELPLGYEFQVRAKSGLSLKTKMRLSNCLGTIDANYRGFVGVIVDNIDSRIKDITYTFDDTGEIHINSILYGSPIHIEKGQKIAQLVLNEVPKAHFYEVEKINEDTDRGTGGYGSTGK